LRNHEAHP
jgi:hypothetical protein